MSTSRTVPVVAPGVLASVAVPGSKSIANRALACAALADGTSRLDNVPDGDDTTAMSACLRALGVSVDGQPPALTVTGQQRRWEGGRPLHAGLAGTTSRFATAIAALGDAPITIDGEPPLQRRPFGPLHDALRQIGVDIVTPDGPGTLPVTVIGPPTSGVMAIAGDVSSQYITALMLIGPYLPGGLQLELTTPLVSLPYVEMTAAIMSIFGAEGIVVAEGRVVVEQGGYRGTALAIEPDASSASYPLAIAAVCDGAVSVPGLTAASLQGDARFVEVLARIGCQVQQSHDATTVRGTGRLTGIDLDMADISDLVPTLAVVALFADTPTRISGVGFIRGKESDRLGDLAHELRRAGATVDVVDDGLVVHPSASELHAASLETHHDHRLAMAFGVLGSRVAGIEVQQPEVVSKSWPGFWTMLDGLGSS